MFSERHKTVFYSLVITCTKQCVADKIYNAFNGRYFNDVESRGELMHTVFLSEKQLSVDSDCDDLHLLAIFSERHPESHFDRLPTCPSCLEKLDGSLSGLQQIPITAEQCTQDWQGLQCPTCAPGNDLMC